MHRMRAVMVVFAFFMFVGGAGARVGNGDHQLRGKSPDGLVPGVRGDHSGAGERRDVRAAVVGTSVEGQVYAQPLLADGTLLVATELNDGLRAEPGRLAR